MNHTSFFAFLLLLAGCKDAPIPVAEAPAPSAIRCAPPLVDADWYTRDTPAPLFAGMDLLSFPVTTTSAEAQRFFNQGLLLAYAFNHAEAARSFYQSMRLDPECAMCHWGYAYVLGPNYNAGMEPDHYPRAYEAIRKAVVLSPACTDREKAMINAMALRYTPDAPDDRRHLDSAYMVAMREVHRQYPDDVDIAAMYAESLMDMHPWDLWDKEGRPKPWTPEILKAIEVAIRLNPKHPGGHHFNIHAWEASATPEKGLVSAKAFDDGLVPEAGHLVHMPSHIYINTGDYHLGSIANIRAVEKDSAYVTQCHAYGAYPLAYYPHNYHFLAACATLEGKSEWAIDAAGKMADMTNHTGMLIPLLATLQHYHSIPDFVLVKFARWDEILRRPPLDSALIYPRAVRLYATGMAQLGHGDLPAARATAAELTRVAAMDTFAVLTIWEINSLADVLNIAEKVLRGEILVREGKYAEAERLLREAVALEDALNYNEPPDWFFSVRHHLGAMLLEAGRPDEAIAVYLADLEVFPKNGWALQGLTEAYRALGHTEQLVDAKKRFEEAWAHADVALSGGRVAPR